MVNYTFITFLYKKFFQLKKCHFPPCPCCWLSMQVKTKVLGIDIRFTVYIFNNLGSSMVKNTWLLGKLAISSHDKCPKVNRALRIKYIRLQALD